MKSVKKFFNYFLDFSENELPTIPKGNINGTDNEKCCYFQYEYLINNNEKCFVNLWKLFTLLCKRAVKKEVRLKRFFLDNEEVQYKADIACEYTLRRYRSYKQEGKTYFITNFITAAYSAVMHALYSEDENDLFLSLCKELDGKPTKEAEKRTAKYNAFILAQKTKIKTTNNDNDVKAGQLLLF